MKAYHGTTREQANRFLLGEAKETPTWWCSDDNYLYLWCPDALVDGGECDAEDADEYAIQRAFESAQVAAALSDTPQTELVVLCLEFDKESIEPDDSAEMMELSRRIEDFDGIERCVEYKLIAKHNSRLDAFVVAGLLNNPYICHIDDDLKEAAEAVKEVFLEGILEFDYSIEY